MDYWISSKNVQTGPYSLEQLHLQWQQGQITSDAYYYDGVHTEWLPLKALIENNRQIFTPEEAFTRVGQSRQNGCLLIANKEESIHLFVENGFVIYAKGASDEGEIAVARALHLDEASYEWFFEAKPPALHLRLNIQEYALKNAIANDVKFGGRSKVTKHTVALSGILGDKAVLKPRFEFVLVADETPALTLRLAKVTNVVGREDFCDLVIKANQISRKHCLLEIGDQHVKVKDLDSSNGTFVNGVPVKDGRLNANEKLGLGNYTLTLRKEAKRAPELTA